jgi:hypothetical protein
MARTDGFFLIIFLLPRQLKILKIRTSSILTKSKKCKNSLKNLYIFKKIK